MTTDLNELTCSAYGNIVPYNALHAMLYHPLRKYLFRGEPLKWLPVGLLSGVHNKPETMYALLVDTTLLKRDASLVYVINVQLRGVELTHINDEVVQEFQALLPATSFSDGLPQPFQLQNVGTTDGDSEPKLWETLAHLIDYIDCIQFHISSETT